MTTEFSCNRKANAILDTIVVIGVLFVFVLVTIIGYHIFGEMKGDIYADVNNSYYGNKTLYELDTKYPSVFDGLIIFVFVGLYIMAIISSFINDTHPIFFAIAIILLIFAIIVSIYIANFYGEFFEDDEMSGATSAFPMTNYLMHHLLQATIIVAASILLALYGKTKL